MGSNASRTYKDRVTFPLSRTGFHGDRDLPPKKWSRDFGVRRPGLRCVGPRIRSGWHPERRVLAPDVVDELDVVVDCTGELDLGLPAFAVEQLDLHPPPERLRSRGGDPDRRLPPGRAARGLPDEPGGDREGVALAPPGRLRLSSAASGRTPPSPPGGWRWRCSPRVADRTRSAPMPGSR
jgi:hypothetical protein